MSDECGAIAFAEYLLQLNGLLRPLIHRHWCAMVALLNTLEDSRLEEFLFGAERVPTVKVRAGLWEIQGTRCFYCDRRVVDPGKGHVDHFIPWARYPDNGIESLVVADVTCNAKLWLRRKKFVAVDQEAVRRALVPAA